MFQEYAFSRWFECSFGFLAAIGAACADPAFFCACAVVIRVSLAFFCAFGFLFYSACVVMSRGFFCFPVSITVSVSNIADDRLNRIIRPVVYLFLRFVFRGCCE